MFQNAYDKIFRYILRPMSDDGHNIIVVSQIIFVIILSFMAWYARQNKWKHVNDPLVFYYIKIAFITKTAQIYAIL